MSSLARTFGSALAGLAHTLRTQRNLRIHLAATVFVAVLAGWLRLALPDWAILVTLIGLVWTAELLNTAIELAVDLASPERHSLARTAKDVSASAVLIAALTAAVAGTVILAPPLLDRLSIR